MPCTASLTSFSDIVVDQASYQVLRSCFCRNRCNKHLGGPASRDLRLAFGRRQKKVQKKAVRRNTCRSIGAERASLIIRW